MSLRSEKTYQKGRRCRRRQGATAKEEARACAVMSSENLNENHACLDARKSAAARFYIVDMTSSLFLRYLLVEFPMRGDWTRCDRSGSQ